MVKSKKPMGRKKLGIKRIDKEESRQVCFSKRRQGLFNKAHELSILCGAMVGVVVFSFSGRSYSIGNPSIEAVIKRFIAPNPPNVPGTSHVANQDAGGVTEIVRLLSEQYTALQGLVDEEIKIKDSLQEAIGKEMGGRFMQWLNSKIYDLGQHELQEFYKELQAICGAVLGGANKVPEEARQIQRSHPEPPMDIAGASQQYQFGEPISSQSQLPMDISTAYQFGEPSSQPQPPMDIASSWQYLFGESISQSQPPMDIISSSQHQFGEQSDIDMSLDDLSSTNRFIDEFEVDDPFLSDI